MKLSDAMIRCLQEENVDTIFGYPGAAVVDIYESLRASSIHHVLVRQEQAAVHSASGYARTTGKVGVCIATSGPGATNLITGIATAYMDSIPIVIFTGQVKSNLIGRDVFQEVDITGATEPFVKHSYLIQNPKEFPRIVKEAFYIARTGRPGPVLIDIPMDYQGEQIEYRMPKKVSIRGYKPTVEGHIGQIKKAMKLLEKSERPLICAGGGVILGEAKEELTAFAEKMNIPVVHTLMGLGAIPTTHPLYKGMIGTHGYAHSNWAVRNADTILFIGARIADRAVSNTCVLADNVNIIHIDVDPAEIGKMTSANIPIVGDVKQVLLQMLPLAKKVNTTKWCASIEEAKEEKEEKHPEGAVNPKLFVRALSRLLGDNAIIAADVGQNQFWTVRNMEIMKDRKLICSGGFGTMGYSLPAAIGAAIGNRDKKVVSFFGDGSFQMSLFELGTLIQEKVKPLMILFNNSGLGMVRELQRKVDLKEHGVALNCNPDFCQLVAAYGIKTKRITYADEIEDALKEAIAADEAYFIEVLVSDKETTL